MAIKTKPSGTYKLVWTGDDSIAMNAAARIAIREYVQTRDPAVFARPGALKAGTTLVEFTVRHLSRGAMEFVDQFSAERQRQKAAFRAALVRVQGMDLAIEHEKAWDGGEIVDEECWTRIVDILPIGAIYEIGGFVLANATFGEPEKKALPPPSGAASEG